jgi:hypothetical protein
MIPLLARLLDEGAQRLFLRTKGSWVGGFKLQVEQIV